mmetsp:Transcript_35633/g.113463  ORF Transcript_35633/g.113463 Transcript_35633/m.113463 type:complete len:338 (-) Transcript_35633:46-1059(-)
MLGFGRIALGRRRGSAHRYRGGARWGAGCGGGAHRGAENRRGARRGAPPDAACRRRLRRGAPGLARRREGGGRQHMRRLDIRWESHLVRRVYCGGGRGIHRRHGRLRGWRLRSGRQQCRRGAQSGGRRPGADAAGVPRGAPGVYRAAAGPAAVQSRGGQAGGLCQGGACFGAQADAGRAPGAGNTARARLERRAGRAHPRHHRPPLRRRSLPPPRAARRHHTRAGWPAQHGQGRDALQAARGGHASAGRPGGRGEPGGIPAGQAGVGHAQGAATGRLRGRVHPVLRVSPAARAGRCLRACARMTAYLVRVPCDYVRHALYVVCYTVDCALPEHLLVL